MALLQCIDCMQGWCIWCFQQFDQLLEWYFALIWVMNFDLQLDVVWCALHMGIKLSWLHVDDL